MWITFPQRFAVFHMHSARLAVCNTASCPIGRMQCRTSPGLYLVIHIIHSIMRHCVQMDTPPTVSMCPFGHTRDVIMPDGIASRPLGHAHCNTRIMQHQLSTIMHIAYCIVLPQLRTLLYFAILQLSTSPC